MATGTLNLVSDPLALTCTPLTLHWTWTGPQAAGQTVSIGVQSLAGASERRDVVAAAPHGEPEDPHANLDRRMVQIQRRHANALLDDSQHVPLHRRRSLWKRQIGAYTKVANGVGLDADVFTWDKVNVTPGTYRYVVSVDGTSVVSFSNTFTVTGGPDTSCLAGQANTTPSSATTPAPVVAPTTSTSPSSTAPPPSTSSAPPPSSVSNAPTSSSPPPLSSSPPIAASSTSNPPVPTNSSSAAQANGSASSSHDDGGTSSGVIAAAVLLPLLALLFVVSALVWYHRKRRADYNRRSTRRLAGASLVHRSDSDAPSGAIMTQRSVGGRNGSYRSEAGAGADAGAVTLGAVLADGEKHRHAAGGDSPLLTSPPPSWNSALSHSQHHHHHHLHRTHHSQHSHASSLSASELPNYLVATAQPGSVLGGGGILQPPTVPPGHLSTIFSDASGEPAVDGDGGRSASGRYGNKALSSPSSTALGGSAAAAAARGPPPPSSSAHGHSASVGGQTAISATTTTPLGRSGSNSSLLGLRRKPVQYHHHEDDAPADVGQGGATGETGSESPHHAYAGMDQDDDDDDDARRADDYDGRNAPMDLQRALHAHTHHPSQRLQSTFSATTARSSVRSRDLSSVSAPRWLLSSDDDDGVVAAAAPSSSLPRGGGGDEVDLAAEEGERYLLQVGADGAHGGALNDGGELDDDDVALPSSTVSSPMQHRGAARAHRGPTSSSSAAPSWMPASSDTAASRSSTAVVTTRASARDAAPRLPHPPSSPRGSASAALEAPRPNFWLLQHGGEVRPRSDGSERFPASVHDSALLDVAAPARGREGGQSAASASPAWAVGRPTVVVPPATATLREGTATAGATPSAPTSSASLLAPPRPPPPQRVSDTAKAGGKDDEERYRLSLAMSETGFDVTF